MKKLFRKNEATIVARVEGAQISVREFFLRECARKMSSPSMRSFATRLMSGRLLRRVN